MPDTPDVLLVTCARMPDGDVEGKPLLRAFDRLGLRAEWAVWDDPSVDWGAAGVVAIRTAWDYFDRRPTLLEWADRVEAQTRLVNPAAAVHWNTHKGYLVDLAEAGVPTVPTTVVRAGARAVADGRWAGRGQVVVKPAVGASGRGVEVLPPGASVPAGTVDLVVQPLVESVRTDGELSVFVLGGEPVAAVVKRPAGTEIRVHEEYGGQTMPTGLTEEMRRLSRHAVGAVEDLLDVTLTCARADLMRSDTGELVVSELELVEPSLYPGVLPQVPAAYAAAVAGVLTDEDRGTNGVRTPAKPRRTHEVPES